MFFNQKITPTALFLCLLAAGCSTNRYHTPTMAQVPFLTAGNQASFSAGAGLLGDFKSLQLDAAYSPVSHILLSGTYFNVRNTNTFYSKEVLSSTDFSSEEHSRMWEAAAGAYYPFGMNRDIVLSLLAGLGTGKVRNNYVYSYSPEFYKSSWRQQSFFLQPAIGVLHRQFQVGGGFRLTWLQYDDGLAPNTLDVWEIARLRQLSAASPVLLTSMIFSSGIRWRALFLRLDAVAVLPFNYQRDRLDFTSARLGLTAGVNLHELWKPAK